MVLAVCATTYTPPSQHSGLCSSVAAVPVFLSSHLPLAIDDRLVDAVSLALYDESQLVHVWFLVHRLSPLRVEYMYVLSFDGP